MVLLQFLGGVLALLAHLLLVFLLIKKSKNYDQNFTAWILGAGIDLFIFLLTKEENGNFDLPRAYFLGGLIVAIVLLCQKKISWGKWDTVTTVAVAVFLVIWWQTDNTTALIAGVLASVISFIPQIKDTAIEPKKTPLLVYLVFFSGDALSFIGGDDYSIKEILYAFTELILSLIIILLIFHDKRKT